MSIALVIVYRRFVQKRALWGPDAYRFPKKGFGVDQYRERLQRAGIDPDQVMSPFVPATTNAANAAAGADGRAARRRRAGETRPRTRRTTCA